MYHEIVPMRDYRQSIECFWFLRNEHSTLIHPDGTINLISSQSEIILDNFRKLPAGSYIFFLRNKAMRIYAAAGLVGVRLKLFCFPKLLVSRAAPDFSDDIVDADVFFKHRVSHFFDHKSLIEGKIESLYRVVDKVISHPDIVSNTDRELLNYILIHKGNLRIQEFSEDVGVSRQYIHKAFQKKFGVSVKNLSSIWRLNYFLSLLQEGKDVNDALFLSGYYDQAHCINQCRKYLNVTPKSIGKLNENIQYALVTAHNRYAKKYAP